MKNLLSEQKQAIKGFYKSIELLKDKKVVRSKVIFGDIGEFLSTIVFPNLKLVTEKTNEGYDALDGNKKVQIKFSDSADTQNIKLGDPNQYDDLIVVLTKESAHLQKEEKQPYSDYYFYKFNKEEVKKLRINSGDYTLAKGKHIRQAIETFNLDDL